jgi:hypothetical protein
MNANENEKPGFEELTAVMAYIGPMVFIATGAFAIFKKIPIYDVRFLISFFGFSLIGVSVAWIIATKNKRKELKNKE